MKHKLFSDECWGGIIYGFGMGVLITTAGFVLTQHFAIPIPLWIFGGLCAATGSALVQFARKKRISETHVGQKHDA